MEDVDDDSLKGLGRILLKKTQQLHLKQCPLRIFGLPFVSVAALFDFFELCLHVFSVLSGAESAV